MPTPRPYHHGHLRQALIDMAVTVAEETGRDTVSVREVARRLGVSSGAPFRHFADREALMTAVAEEAMARLHVCVLRDLQGAPADPALRLKVLGRSFVAWAWRHPTPFRLLSSRRVFDFDASARLPVHFDAVRHITLALVAEAQAAGALPPGPVPALALALRALAYGLVRMQVDGQLPQWQVDAREAEASVLQALDLVIDGLRPARPGPTGCGSTAAPGCASAPRCSGQSPA